MSKTSCRFVAKASYTAGRWVPENTFLDSLEGRKEFKGKPTIESAALIADEMLRGFHQFEKDYGYVTHLFFNYVRAYNYHEIYPHLGTSCFGSTANMRDNFLGFFYTGPSPAYVKTTEDWAVAEEFLRWVTSDDSPYIKYKEQLFSDKPLIVNGENVNTFDYRFKYGFIQTDMSVPANLLVNFWKCLRLVRSDIANLRYWKQLKEAGLSPKMAYLMAMHCYKDQRTNEWMLYGAHRGHSAGYGIEEQILRLTHNQPNTKFFLQPIGKSGNFYPCDCIWGNDQLNGGPMLSITTFWITWVEKQLKAEGQTPEQIKKLRKSNTFDDGMVTLPFDEFVRLLKVLIDQTLNSKELRTKYVGV